ncbi:MAG TPA: hypothetical protein VGA73_00230 [Candidatus Binatia bacterium]
MAVKNVFLIALLVLVSACGEKKEDKAKEAVRDVITRDFQYYQAGKEKLGESEKREAERREQEKAIE